VFLFLAFFWSLELFNCKLYVSYSQCSCETKIVWLDFYLAALFSCLFLVDTINNCTCLTKFVPKSLLNRTPLH
jgi:hypothetical protein